MGSSSCLLKLAFFHIDWKRHIDFYFYLFSCTNYGYMCVMLARYVKFHSTTYKQGRLPISKKTAECRQKPCPLMYNF